MKNLKLIKNLILNGILLLVITFLTTWFAKSQIIVIDPGHGYNNICEPKCDGVTRTKTEIETAFAVGSKLKKLINDNCSWTVHMTITNNDCDNCISIVSRAEMANDWNADILLSIHCNGLDGTATGTETFWCDQSLLNPVAEEKAKARKAFAEEIHERMIQYGEWIRRRVAEDHSYLGIHLGVLRRSNAVGCLNEIGFADNPSDEAKLLDNAWRDKFAQAYYTALQNHLGISCNVNSSSSGPIIISGLDTEYQYRPTNTSHGSIPMWASVINNAILSKVTNSSVSSGGILVLGGGKSSNDMITDFWKQIGTTLGRTITFKNGTSISSVPFDPSIYSMIVVASTNDNGVVGGLTFNTGSAPYEFDLVCERASDINTFINNGGGFFASTSHSSALNGAFGYFNIGSPPLISFPQHKNNSTPTPEGIAVGIAPISGPFHNYFSQWPSFLKVLSNLNNPTQAVILGGINQDVNPEPIIRIPVVVHVLYNSKENNLTDGQICAAINYLNKDFNLENENKDECPSRFKSLQANCKIKFCLASRDEKGNPTNGITRKDIGSKVFKKPLYRDIYPHGRIPILELGGDEAKFDSKGGENAWNRDEYLNIWIVPKIGKIIGGDEDGDFLGYAQYPGGPSLTDGVVIQAANFGEGQRTATHEIGHWLNLLHNWNPFCIGDDVTDTPLQSSSYNFECPPKEEPISSCLNGSDGDMYTNYMTYASDNCMNMFTLGQKERMRKVFELNGYRYSILSSKACDPVASLPVEIKNLPNGNAPPSYNGNCSATLDAGIDGSAYLWNTGETTKSIIVKKSGTYSVIIKDEIGCANTLYYIANITDKVKPIVKTKNLNVVLDNFGKVIITPEMIENGSSDNCGIKSLSINLNMFACKNIGANTVYLTVSDNSGNTSSGKATVNVSDPEPPKLNCPADRQGYTKLGQCSIPLNSAPLGTPTGLNDNCGIKHPVTNNAPSNFPVGITNVIWTVADVNSNKTNCIQQITVIPNSCGKPNQVVPLDITKNSAKIKWQAGTCGLEYQLNYRQEITPGVYGVWSTWVISSGPGLQHIFTNLLSNKNYQFQIRAKCGTVFSGVVIGSFKTKLNIKDDDSQNRNSITNDLSNSINLPAKIEIIPNPARHFTTLFMEGFENISKEVSMFDINGKLVFRVYVDADDNELELELKTLSVHTGIYFIRVSDNYKQKTERLVIEKI